VIDEACSAALAALDVVEIAALRLRRVFELLVALSFEARRRRKP
jgi:hypothetical protein